MKIKKVNIPLECLNNQIWEQVYDQVKNNIGNQRGLFGAQQVKNGIENLIEVQFRWQISDQVGESSR